MIKNREILIVDDSETSTQYIQNILINNFEVNVYTAKDAWTAMRLVGNHDIDIILMDVVMPVIDGFKTAHIMQESKKGSRIPIIFISGNDQKNQFKSKSFDFGAIDYLKKPFNERELVKLVSLYFRFIDWEKRVNQKLEDKNTQLQYEIDSRIRTENKLLENEAKLREMNIAKDKFFSIIAHDLKNPFNVMMQYTNLLRMNYDRLDDTKRINYIEQVDLSINHTFKLLENLLEWSRAQTGRIKYNPEKINLTSFAFDIIYGLKNQADIKNLSLKIDIDDSYQVWADQNMLATILRNLTSNAIKFTPEGGEISIYSIIKDNYFHIIVKDSGVGISPKRQEKLFDIDGAGSTPGTNLEAGTGLGLVLCKEFVEINGGEIDLISEEGKGTTIEFSIPAFNNNGN